MTDRYICDFISSTSTYLFVVYFYNNEQILQSGLIGVSPGQVEVKCLHAHLADHLVRGDANRVGARVVKLLSDEGVTLEGEEECWKQRCGPPVSTAQHNQVP